MKQETVETIFSTLPPTQVVYRVTHGGNRIYYTLDENNNPSFFISLTTMIRATVPKSEQLIKWQCEMGYAEAKRYMNERADYGSLYHILLGEYITRGKYNFADTADLCIKYCQQNGYMWKDEWVDDLNDDIAAFMQFVIDYKVIPMAVEIVLVSKDGYGTPLDLICKMTIQEDGLDHENVMKSGKNKGEPRAIKIDKQITAAINFKSGRKGFYEDNEIQLEFEKRLAEENFPDLKIDRVYNFSPKEWKTNPTYNLKDQTDSVNKDKAEAILQIAKIELLKRTPTFRVIEGEVKYGESAVVSKITLAEKLKALHDERAAQAKLEEQFYNKEFIS